jgi:hypothetical protein
MSRPNSRQALVDYCLRSLGYPVIEINVDEDQIEDRVDEALQFYQLYHSDSIEKIYLKHQITTQDIENKYITLNDLITDVVRVLPIRQANSSQSLFSIEYQMHLDDIFSLGFMGTLVNYSLSKQWLSLLDIVVNDDNKAINFEKHKNQLRIDMDWGESVREGSFIIVECYRILDPEEYNNVYNDYFLKRYLTALIKRQWGANLIKFEGMTMPGGVTFNGRQIFDDANTDIEKLEEEVRLAWEEPPAFFTG